MAGNASPNSTLTPPTGDLREQAFQDRPPELPPAPATTRRLRRSRTGRMVAGVCGGLGRYLDIDPALLRIALVVLAIAGVGTGIVAYLIGWIVIPEEAPGEEVGAAPPPARDTGSLLVGSVLIVLGVLFLIRQVAPWFDDRIIWPLVLIGIGLLVALRGIRR